MEDKTIINYKTPKFYFLHVIISLLKSGEPGSEKERAIKQIGFWTIVTDVTFELKPKTTVYIAAGNNNFPNYGFELGEDIVHIAGKEFSLCYLPIFNDYYQDDTEGEENFEEMAKDLEESGWSPISIHADYSDACQLVHDKFIKNNIEIIKL